MTKDAIIKQLIISNIRKDWDQKDEMCFSLDWKCTKLTYSIEANKDKSLADMVNWFYDKIMELSDNDKP